MVEERSEHSASTHRAKTDKSLQDVSMSELMGEVEADDAI